jgi:hypothetical protein
MWDSPKVQQLQTLTFDDLAAAPQGRLETNRESCPVQHRLGDNRLGAWSCSSLSELIASLLPHVR